MRSDCACIAYSATDWVKLGRQSPQSFNGSVHGIEHKPAPMSGMFLPGTGGSHPISTGDPYRCTAMTARVREVILASRSFGSSNQVTGRICHDARAGHSRRGCNEGITAGTMTSSPGSIPSANKARCRAAVPEARRRSMEFHSKRQNCSQVPYGFSVDIHRLIQTAKNLGRSSSRRLAPLQVKEGNLERLAGIWVGVIQSKSDRALKTAVGFSVWVFLSRVMM